MSDQYLKFSQYSMYVVMFYSQPFKQMAVILFTEPELKPQQCFIRIKLLSVGRGQSALKVKEMCVSVEVADWLCWGERNFPLLSMFFRLI